MSKYIYKDFDNNEVEIDFDKLVEVGNIGSYKIYSMPKKKVNSKINKVVFASDNKNENEKEEIQYDEFRATVVIFTKNIPTVENGRSKYFIMGNDAYDLIQKEYRSSNVIKLIPILTRE